MTSNDLAQILKYLPSLKPSELETVRQRIDFLRGIAPTKLKEDWLLEGLTDELRRRGLWAKTYAVSAQLHPKGYAQKSIEVRQYLLQGFKAKPRAVELRALGGLAGMVLAEYLKRANVPLSPKTLLGALDKVPQALEASFPGYWANKLLGACLKLVDGGFA